MKVGTNTKRGLYIKILEAVNLDLDSLVLFQFFDPSIHGQPEKCKT